MVRVCGRHGLLSHALTDPRIFTATGCTPLRSALYTCTCVQHTAELHTTTCTGVRSQLRCACHNSRCQSRPTPAASRCHQGASRSGSPRAGSANLTAPPPQRRPDVACHWRPSQQSDAHASPWRPASHQSGPNLMLARWWRAQAAAPQTTHVTAADEGVTWWCSQRCGATTPTHTHLHRPAHPAFARPPYRPGTEPTPAAAACCCCRAHGCGRRHLGGAPPRARRGTVVRLASRVVIRGSVTQLVILREQRRGRIKRGNAG